MAVLPEHSEADPDTFRKDLSAGSRLRYPRGGPPLLSGLALLLAVAALYAAYARGATQTTSSPASDSVRLLSKRLDSLSSAVAVDELMREIDAEPTLDLHESNLKSIGDGFAVGGLTVSAEPGGVRVRGTIVNTEAVSHESATLKFKTRGESTSVFVSAIPAGGSALFSAYVAGVPPDSAKYGWLKYQHSTVLYHPPH